MTENRTNFGDGWLYLALVLTVLLLADSYDKKKEKAKEKVHSVVVKNFQKEKSFNSGHFAKLSFSNKINISLYDVCTNRGNIKRILAFGVGLGV